MYANDFITAEVCYFLSITWLGLKILTSAPIRSHSSRAAVSICIVFIGGVIFWILLALVKYRHEQVMVLKRPEPVSKEATPRLSEQMHATMEPSGAQPKSTVVAKKERYPALVPNKPVNIPIQQSKKPVVSTTVPLPVPSVPPSLPATQSLSTDEIATAVAKRIIEQQPPPPARPCRGDELSTCTDEALIQWGEPLVENITKIVEKHSAEMDIMGEFKGDKLLKGLVAADRRAVDDYRNCCAEDALKFEKELALRLTGGSQNIAFGEWTHKLMQPIGSRDWKYARENADMIMDIRFKLSELESELDRNIKLRKIREVKH
jgi:hypothetical protein